MNRCDCNNKCGECHGGCKPARYSDCTFDIQANPYNSHEWIITANGMPHKVRVPSMNETDTTLSTNYSNSALNYKAEKHTDIVTGQQLGDIIELGDLRDVNFDPAFTGICSELIYHKFQDCGEGCTSPADQWSGFNVNSEGAKKSAIRFVRGANVYGCPEYLNVPTTLNQYWFAGWRTDGNNKQFGYFQPTTGTIPTDANGDPIVMSINQTTKAPIIGTLKTDPLGDAICTNFTPKTGYKIAEGGGNTFCYYPHLRMAAMSLDIQVTQAHAANTEFDLPIATITNRDLWPTSTYDLPCHVIWNNNSDGAVTAIRVRFNASGEVLLSGYIPARTTTGKASFILDGVDDMVVWDPQGV